MYLSERETCKKIRSHYSVTFGRNWYHYELMENSSDAIMLSIEGIGNGRTKHAVEIN